MTKRLELTGRQFGRLTVRGMLDWRYRQSTVWQCRCTCGRLTTVVGYNLVSGGTKSCGCLQRENAGKASRRRWEQWRAIRPYPPAAIVNRVYDATLTPGQQRAWARELARVLLVEGCGEPDYGTAFNLTCRTRLYPHLRPALPGECKEMAA